MGHLSRHANLIYAWFITNAQKASGSAAEFLLEILCLRWLCHIRYIKGCNKVKKGIVILLACLFNRLYALPIILQPLFVIFYPLDAVSILGFALFYAISPNKSTRQTDSQGYFFQFFKSLPYPDCDFLTESSNFYCICLYSIF